MAGRGEFSHIARVPIFVISAVGGFESLAFSCIRATLGAMSITITTSNVNGIRAAKRKGIETWAAQHTPNVWCMQEVRAPQNEIDPILDEFAFEYATAGAIGDQGELARTNEVCRVKGRAGVALLTDLAVTERRYGLPGLDEDVDSGRWIENDITTPSGNRLTVVCVYVHAGNTDDPEKMRQKYRFLDTMLVRMGELRDEAAHGGRQAVLCGDFNIAHTPLDIKNAKANEKHAGFLPEERAYVDKWLGELEFVDVMRSLSGDIQGPYTWWSQRGRAFDNNVGWRIDYQFATPELAESARGFVIDKAPTYDSRWSDHAPLSITYDV